jgi:hypothetical protein
LFDQVTRLVKAPWGGSTNIQKAFDLILEVAVAANVLPEGNGSDFSHSFVNFNSS